MTGRDLRAATGQAPAQIDVLTSPRFFFGMWVLLMHSGSTAMAATGAMPVWANTLMSNAQAAVSYFFTLSGFVLAYAHYSQFRSMSDVTRYLRSRFARVYPVFFLSLVLLLPFASQNGWRVDLPQFFLLQCWQPLASVTFSNWNMEARTLSVELFCYLTFPITIVLLEKLSTRAIIVAAGVVCLAILVLRLPAIASGEHAPYAWMLFVPFMILRWPEFLLGVLLGTIFKRGEAPRSALTLHLLLACALGLAVFSHGPFTYALLAIVFGLAILWLTTSAADSPLNGILTHPVAVMLGRASYGLYILQLPVHDIYFAAVDPRIAKLTYAVLMILLSIVVFYGVEEPFQKLLRGQGRRPQTLQPAE